MKEDIDIRIDSLKAELDNLRDDLHKDVDEQLNDIRYEFLLNFII